MPQTQQQQLDGQQFPEQSRGGEMFQAAMARRAERYPHQYTGQRSLLRQLGSEVAVMPVTVPIAAPAVEAPTPVAPVVERVVQDEATGLTDLRSSVAAAFEPTQG